MLSLGAPGGGFLIERYVELEILKLSSNSSQFALVHTHKKAMTSICIVNPS
jgi:hypothetical protein